MALELVTGPTQEPLTLAEAKLHARIDTDDDDQLLMALITTAREWIEGQTHRALVTQTWDWHIDWGWPYMQNGVPTLDFPINPVVSVTSITYEDGSSPRPTLDASRYTAVTREHNSYVVPAYGETWPTLRSVPNAITVRFVAGQAIDAVPLQLVQALKMLVTHMYERRDLSAEKQMVEIPYAVEALISPYRRSVMG